ncbi:MAG: Acyltransferase family protein [candidate division WS6 bacterium OLB20]|uniref:Acyltransferase family protein n=1 Tax=candidate division WS6 bacterium OLB20 TaxID=1617426 RepID=A0A136LZK3_9BACT|nr:MAG: Acyltransferase family protein [candidate division WS6 bacterium OLB20]
MTCPEYGVPVSAVLYYTGYVKTKKTVQERDTGLDMARGIAVLLMLFAHSVVFFNFNQNPLLRIIGQFGDIVVFSTFLFISGAVSYVAYLSVSETTWKQKRGRLLARAGRLLLVYYLIGIIGSYKYWQGLPVTSLPRILFEILTFTQVPSYSEFLIPFILYAVLFLFFRGLYRAAAESTWMAVLVSVIAYSLGSIIHATVTQLPAGFYTSFIAGYSDWFRFPVLQYTPVLIAGMYWSARTKSATAAGKAWLAFIWTAMWVFIIIAFNFNAYTTSADTVVYEPGIYYYRWPPSIQFLIIGIAFASLAMLVVQLVRSIDRAGVVQGPLTFIGANAFGFYFYHIVLLYLYRFAFNRRIENPFAVVALWLLLVAFCTALIYLVRILHYRLHIDKLHTRMSELLKGRKSVLLVAAAALFFLLVFSFNTIATTAPRFEQAFPPTDPEVEGIFLRTANPVWWDSTYKYHRRLTIENNNADVTAQRDTQAEFSFDHSALVEQGKSLADGSDLRLIYFTGEGYRVLSAAASGLNTSQAVIRFPLVLEVPPLTSDDYYFLYYGNDSVLSAFSEIPQNAAAQVGTVLGEEKVAAITVSLPRKWLLRGQGLTEEHTQMPFTVDLGDINISGDEVRVAVQGREIKSLTASRTRDNLFTVMLDGSDFQPGRYTLVASTPDGAFESATTEFNVSYPLYVTWSIDYEGFDVSKQYLDAMIAISEKYDMPVTHLFNPRIFIAGEVSRARASELVAWVLNRETQGDEIGLHLHMHTDMVRAAGLTPHEEPRWGGRVNGHDVLTTNYNYQEFDQLIKWSLDQFSKNGLPRPITFRAGGWFIDEENLQVLADNGFRVDTSGREFLIYGPNEIPHVWNLEITTRPFKPSVSDQNSDTPPQIDIWEFPNNGLDSTNNPGSFLIDRFNANYTGGTLREAQTVSYMSHPHWFNIYDNPKMYALLDHVENFAFKNDKGPVLYVTHEQALRGWELPT